MRRHDDWSTPSFDLEPTAPAVGPFPRRPFLSAVHRLESCKLEFVDSGTAFLALCRSEDRLRFVGSPDLTDYHSPLGTGVADLVEALATEVPSGTVFDLDSLPLEAAKPLVAGLEAAGLAVETVDDGVTAVLELPDDFGEYLRKIGKKQRHEVRRKRRRFEEAVGPVVLETHHGPGWAFDEFVRLHRSAPGAKGGFMTPDREEFFRSLAATPGWRIDLLRRGDRALACSFAFSDQEGIYLYNGSYDPDWAEASPGVVLLTSLIEQSIVEGLRRFDFLKGDEEYKFRLGAEPRGLYRVRAVK